MSSRASLLAELEEKSQKNKGIENIPHTADEPLQTVDDGYNPYDNPGTPKVMTGDCATEGPRRTRQRRRDRR